MKLGYAARRPLPALAGLAGLAFSATLALATPTPNGANFRLYVFPDCPISTVTVVNSFPGQIIIDDANTVCTSGFANLHVWSYSIDGGATAAAFSNGDAFKMSAVLLITGTKDGEAGLRISPWYSQYADGRFNVRTTDGEIATFGGRLPSFNFTTAYGLHYTKGNPIYLEITVAPNGLSLASPGSIEYRLVYQSHLYSSGILLFDQGNPAEDPPYGLWGILNDARAGGYIQPFIQGGIPGNLRAQWDDMKFLNFDPVPAANASWGHVKNIYR